MFKRRRPVEPEETEELHEELSTQEERGGESDLYSECAAMLASCPNPFAGLIVVIEHLHRSGAVDAEELAMLGIGNEERQALEAAFENNNSIDELADDVALAAHLRSYRKTIQEIAEEVGATSEEARENLRRNLAGFALENDIEDLRLAFRLMRLERPDLIG
jgi:hypothetical protein